MSIIEIHKYFRDSTPDGIQFQFRAIKRDADALRQGKEPATPSSSSTPKTPRTTGGRKRGAPSTGKTPASKKAKADSVKKFTDNYNANLDDDDSENEYPSLDLTPSKPVRVNEQKLREYQASMGSYYPAETPALEPAQAAATPEDDDDVKIVTPADAGPAFSFAQSTTASGNDGLSNWDNPFSLGTSYFSDTVQKNSCFEDDEEAGEC